MVGVDSNISDSSNIVEVGACKEIFVSLNGIYIRVKESILVSLNVIMAARTNKVLAASINGVVVSSKDAIVSTSISISSSAYTLCTHGEDD